MLRHREVNNVENEYFTDTSDEGKQYLLDF